MGNGSWFNLRLMNCLIFIFIFIFKGQLFKRSLKELMFRVLSCKEELFVNHSFFSCVTIFILLADRTNRYLLLKQEYFKIPRLILSDLSQSK